MTRWTTLEGYRDPTAGAAMTEVEIKRRATGRSNRRNGEILEGMILAACADYRETGRAQIDKTPEPMRIIRPYDRKLGQFVAVFAKKAQPDFKGVLKGGRMIVFDAKHTDSDRVQYSAITDEQRVCLDHCAAMGAEAGVLVSFGFARCYMIPWVIWREMKKQYGRKYMLEDEAGLYEVKMQSGRVYFLDAKEGER